MTATPSISVIPFTQSPYSPWLGLGPYHLLASPTVSLPSCYGAQREPDTRFVEVVNAWIDFNRGIGTIRDQLIAGLALNGVTPEQVPAELNF